MLGLFRSLPLNLYDGPFRFVHHLHARRRKLLLPLLKRRMPFRGHRIRRGIPRGGVNLLLCIDE